MDATDTRCSYQPSQLDRNMYYILTENHYYGSKLFQAGSMCYLKEQTYLQHISRTSTRLWRFVMEQDASVATLDVESLQPVNEKMADFLLAISNAQERLNCFLDRQALEAAVTAEEGQQFLPASEDNQVEAKRQKADGIVPVKMGDTVGFYLDDAFMRGIVLEVYQKGNEWLVKVCPEEEGSADVFREIPLDSVDSGLQEYLKQKRSESTEHPADGTCSLDVNSVVQINLDKGRAVTGTIRWIGCLPNAQQRMAGIELDEENNSLSNGEWQGVRYFTCPPHRALFVRLESCQPDSRFQGNKCLFQEPSEFSEADSPSVLSNSPPLRDDVAVNVLKGRMRGIQGHCNSCYMDAALFSLFSCTSVLDSMLYKPPLPADGRIQEILRDKIVNPLRQKGFVAAKSVMDLRYQLTEKGESSSFATSEKDPEEFLNLIMHRILGLEPLLKLQSGKLKEQECYCYQIFMDKQENLVVPNVQQLVEHSFLTSDLKLVEIPSCFILQMPRFGKEYKMFNKIIPSLELDITDLLLDSPRECFVCGDIATQECSACFKDKMFAGTGLKQFCDSCCSQVCAVLLFSLLFCFLRSAAEDLGRAVLTFRAGDENGYNIPTVTLCPEVAKYLEMPVSSLAMEQPRDMEGVAKRLFCDAYMYMYQSKKMALYK
ncbi:hypothetical protein Chor_010624 [Crotalus horridus]